MHLSSNGAESKTACSLDLLHACSYSQTNISAQDHTVQELIRSGADDVKSKALQTAGNLAFCSENRILLRQSEGMREIMLRLADYTAATVKHEVRASAIRALAILGEASAAWHHGHVLALCIECVSWLFSMLMLMTFESMCTLYFKMRCITMAQSSWPPGHGFRS